MKYILYYKMFYITLLFINIVLLALWVEDFDVDSYVIYLVFHGFILLSINVYNSWKIKSSEVSAFIYYIEIGISFYRLGGILLVASLIFSHLIIEFSPLTFSVWRPALDLSKFDGGNYYWWLLLFLMFFLESCNLFLLRKNKQALGSNLAKNV